ncbi:MAG: EAL domain-containing protein, partial [Pseudomonadota bacterium]|nr:EAL domain-containing protein [Pseudomonadota bacterium]
SSFSYLMKFQIDKVKIDRSFTQNIGQSSESAAVVTSIITLGHEMGLRVTAEGVETLDQHTFLCKAGCDELQGYMFSSAVAEEEIADLLKRLEVFATRPEPGIARCASRAGER